MAEVSFFGLRLGTPRTQLALDSVALCTSSLSEQLLHTLWALELHSEASQASLSIPEGAFLAVPCPVTNCSEPRKLWATHFCLNLFLKCAFVSSAHEAQGWGLAWLVGRLWDINKLHLSKSEKQGISLFFVLTPHCPMSKMPLIPNCSINQER